MKSRIIDYLPIILVSSLYGTYLDLYFVGKGLYSFPVRPWPDIFTINLAFTFIGLPFLTLCFLFVCIRLNRWKQVMFILALSMIMAVFEKQTEALGLFAHHHSWIHLYSFIGYSIYFTMIFAFNQFIMQIKK